MIDDYDDNRHDKVKKAVLASVNASFLLLIFSLGFMQPYVGAFGYPMPLTDFIFPVVFALWILALFIKAARFRWNRLYFVLVLYLGAMTLSTAFSLDQQKSVLKLFGEIYLLGLAVLTIHVVTNLEIARKTLYAWLAATSITCIISVLSLILFYFDRDSFLLRYTLSYYGTLPPGNYPRVLSTFLNANMLCNYLSVSTVFLLAAHKLGWINRTLFVTLLVLLIAAICLSISPGIGGVLLCIGMWFWIDLRYKGRYRAARFWLALGLFSAGAFFVLLLIALGDNTLAEFQIELMPGYHVFSSERLSGWIAALRTIAENPIVGRGLGLDAVEVYSYLASGKLHFMSDAHQVWLNFAAQTGLVGLCSICLLTVYLFRRSMPFRFFETPNSILRVTFGLAFVGAFIYQGLGGSFEDARHLWVLIGLLAGFGETDQPT